MIPYIDSIIKDFPGYSTRVPVDIFIIVTYLPHIRYFISTNRTKHQECLLQSSRQANDQIVNCRYLCEVHKYLIIYLLFCALMDKSQKFLLWSSCQLITILCNIQEGICTKYLVSLMKAISRIDQCQWKIHRGSKVLSIGSRFMIKQVGTLRYVLTITLVVFRLTKFSTWIPQG